MISGDFVGNLPSSTSGFKSKLMVMDEFLKLRILFPIGNATSGITKIKSLLYKTWCYT